LNPERRTGQYAAMPDPQRRILVVDDDDTMPEVLQLAFPEYEVASVRDAESALKVASSFRPDLFIVDLVLPGMRGTSLALLLRDDPHFAETPIFLISGLVEAPALGEPVRVQGLPAFRKPFSLELLRKQAAAHLAGPESAREALAQLEPGGISGEG
jgi:CheY-like chemotaxis protein